MTISAFVVLFQKKINYCDQCVTSITFPNARKGLRIHTCTGCVKNITPNGNAGLNLKIVYKITSLLYTFYLLKLLSGS